MLVRRPRLFCRSDSLLCSGHLCSCLTIDVLHSVLHSVLHFALYFSHIRRIVDSLLTHLDYTCRSCRYDSAFPVMRKVGNVGIFAQLLMEINWKQLSGGGNYILSGIGSRSF